MDSKHSISSETRTNSGAPNELLDALIRKRSISQHEATGSSRTSTSEVQFLLSEYSALRTELLKRIEMQFQLVSLAILIAGTIITFSIPKDLNSNLNLTLSLLVYPLFATFLAISWSQHDVRNRQIGIYIKDVIEAKLVGDGVGWEHRKVATSEIIGIKSLVLILARGIFIGSQILLVVLYMYVSGHFFPEVLPEILLIGLDILAIGLTIYILRVHRVHIRGQQ
jgi:hypothetical protein